METIFLVADVLISCFDLYLCCSFFRIFSADQKQSFLIRAALILTFLCISLVPAASVIWNQIVPASLILMISFCYKLRWKVRVITAAAYVGVSVGCDVITGVTLILLQNINMDTIQGSAVAFTSGVLLFSKFLTLFTVRLIKMFWRKYKSCLLYTSIPRATEKCPYRRRIPSIVSSNSSRF